MSNNPPAKRTRPAPPGAPDANARLDKMWKDHIKPALDKLISDGGKLAEQVKNLNALFMQVAEIKVALTTSLYDPAALQVLTDNIQEVQDVIRSTPAKAREILAELERSEVHERQLVLERQAEDIVRPLRVDINNATYVNEADKTKFTYPNDKARDAALANQLAKSDDYQKIVVVLDEVQLEKALAKGELEDLERERKAASQLLRSYEAQLNNLTARLMNSTPIRLGGDDD